MEKPPRHKPRNLFRDAAKSNLKALDMSVEDRADDARSIGWETNDL